MERQRRGRAFGLKYLRLQTSDFDREVLRTSAVRYFGPQTSKVGMELRSQKIQQRRKRARGRQDSQPRKKRRIDEAAVAEERLQRTALIAMRTSDFRARSKMKATRLVLDEDSSPKSRRIVKKECPSLEARLAEKAARGKEETIRKKPCSRKSRQKAVENVAAVKSELQKVTSPCTSTDTIILEKGEEPSAEETQSPTLRAANVLSVQVDELQVAAEEMKREYQTELAVMAKKLSEYEAARIADLELIEKFETQCGEFRTQRSQAEEQLCEVEAKLTKAEVKNRQLSEETREALTARVERCLRGYVLWQIESHNEL
ncbi:hypothetical protein AXG93_4303s1050 [Marchantia polymorpha subsp. ruderalis]|uniref:Uncharacterized protein n=1 Tax=Marchantia polymorpha subsp. ruderalis TaxID=1480154 RepID=A0A176WTS7_MARPO|nr:hypothetical protein AXG93_4303s1050 [Marchantia polymorpha subsp. ruderalis]